MMNFPGKAYIAYITQNRQCISAKNVYITFFDARVAFTVPFVSGHGMVFLGPIPHKVITIKNVYINIIVINN